MSQPFMAEIKVFSFGFAPNNWALTNGQTLPINQNQALFSLLGTTYGGNGQTTFMLPDLRARMPIAEGRGHGLGESAGALTAQLAVTTSRVGGSAASGGLVMVPRSPSLNPIATTPPYLAVNFSIALAGIFPSQN